MSDRIKSILIQIRRDERGMEAVQIIMTLAIAAMVCLGVSKISGVSSDGVKSSGIMGTIKDIAGEFLGSALDKLF